MLGFSAVSGRLVLAGLVLVSASGCKNDGSTCNTTLDCAAAGERLSVCVNQTCARTCEHDLDCRDPDAPAVDNQLVCTRGVCTPGCAAEGHGCPDGESCREGRCVLYAENFEAPRCTPQQTCVAGRCVPNPSGSGSVRRPGDPIELRFDLCFMGIDAFDGVRRIENRATFVAYRGAPGCVDGVVDPDRCGGPPGDGDYYLVAERQQTPAVAQKDLGETCGACRCCLECRDASQREAQATSCLGIALPDGAVCSPDVPAACQAMCAACEACPERENKAIGERLNPCEQTAAKKACTACLDYETCTRTSTTPCDDARDACWACRDAKTATDPDKRRLAEARCAAQGQRGCYLTPIAFPRSDLSDDDAAIESPEIDLSRAAGDVTIELATVAFNVSSCYRRVLQGRPQAEWPIEHSEVQLQFCKSDCGRSMSWVNARVHKPAEVVPRNACTPGGSLDPALARVPAARDLSNGIRYAEQARLDWTTRRLVASIPESLRSSTFRFRLVPRLTKDARVGIDAIVIRRTP